MRVLVGHNYYQHFGGEDAVFEAECQLLKDFSHDVFVFSRDNRGFAGMNFFQKLLALKSLKFSRKTYDELRQNLKSFKPDIAHFHNVFYLLTPAVYAACEDEGVPVVQSLHNYRLFSLNGLLYPDSYVDERRPAYSLREGAKRKEFKNSRLMSYLLADMICRHWEKGTWQSDVQAYITATQFGAAKFVSAGIPEDRIFVKPNFIYPDPGYDRKPEKYFLYVGRLSEEKGVGWLLKVWREMEDCELRIVGSGPLDKEVRELSAGSAVNIKLCGFLEKSELERMMREAAGLIVPSLCYENFPRIVAEAFGYGLPVYAVNQGCFQDIVTEGETGVLFDTDDIEGFKDKIRWGVQHPEKLEALGQKGRAEFERKYTASINHEQLSGIYQKVISSYKTKRGQ